MKNPTLRVLLPIAAVTLLMFGAAGCAKKAVQAPPAAPPAPATTPAPTPPAPAPTPTPAPVSTVTELVPVFFAYDSYALDGAARTALDRNAKYLRENGGSRIVIEGHCDERGTVEYNQALGERRAQAARQFLVDAAIEPSRIDIVSYGKERPFDEGHDETAWSKNRRAHPVVR